MRDVPALVLAADDALAAMQAAVDTLKSIGFEFRYTSLKSETCYYGLPGWHGVIRVSTHSKHSRTAQRDGVMPIAAFITFGHSQGGYSPLAIERRVAEGLGQYFLKRLRAERDAS